MQAFMSSLPSDKKHLTYGFLHIPHAVAVLAGDTQAKEYSLMNTNNTSHNGTCAKTF